MRTALAALVLAVLVAALAAGPAAAQDPAPPKEDPLELLPGPRVCKGGSSVKASHRAQRLAMHCIINRIRRNAGLKRLHASYPLRRAAMYKARRIAACKKFTHSPCGDRLAAPFHEADVTKRRPWFVGENLGWRRFTKATAREIARGWLISPRHRQVLLDERFTHLGVRRRRLRMRGAPVGAVLWVAHLGTPKKPKRG